MTVSPPDNAHRSPLTARTRTPAFPTLSAGRFGLRPRLILLVVAAVAPFLLLVGLVARQHLMDQRPEAVELAFVRSRSIANRLDDRLRNLESVLFALSPAVSADPADRPSNDRILSGVASRLPPGFARWTVYSSDDQLIGSSTAAPAVSGEAHVRRMWRESDSTGQISLTDPMIAEGGEYIIWMTLRFTDARGRGALMAAEFSVRSLNPLTNPFGLPDGSVVGVVNRRGVVLARSREPERWVGRNISSSPGVTQAIEQRNGTMEIVSVDGVRRLTAFATLRRAPWLVSTAIPMSAVFAQARWDFGRAIGYGGLALILAIVLAWTQASRIIIPLRRLAADATQLGSGNLAHRSGVWTSDELGALAMTMNEMANTLEHQGSELRENESRYRALFETNPVPMWVFDRNSLEFLAVNTAALHSYDYTKAEFLGMKVTDIRPIEDVPGFLKYLASVRGISSGIMRRHTRKDGSVMFVDSYSANITFAGRESRLVVANDVTERVHAEEALREAEMQLRQAQRLEALGQLTGGIAHDFNNVLTAIQSYSSFLLDSLDPSDTRRNDVEEIKKAGERAAALTRQLLAFSRSQILQPKILDVNSSIADLEQLLRRLLGADLELLVRCDPDLGHVRADPGQLSQVLINLAVNARDAMPAGGTLTISTRNEDVEGIAPVEQDELTIAPGRYAVLEVTDTGSGMPEEVRQHIFEPFFTTKEAGKGTGLGLSTVYGIVKQSGGHVDVRSAEGKGTTFTIYLPRVDQPAEEDPQSKKDGTAEFSETILVVEDEEAVRSATRRILSRKGYTVLEAGDGNRALEVVAEHGGGIDLVLTDLVMPGMGGRELVRMLRERHRGLRVLYMSGYTKDATMRSELDSTVMVVEKPFTQDELASKVRQALDAV